MLIHHDHQRCEPSDVELHRVINNVAAVILLASIVWLGHTLLSPTTTTIGDLPAAAKAGPIAFAPAVDSASFGNDVGQIELLPSLDRVHVVTFVQPRDIGSLKVEVVDDRLVPVASHEPVGNADVNVDDLPAGTYRVIVAWEASDATEDVEISAASMAMSDDIVVMAGDQLVIDRQLPERSMLATVNDDYSLVVRSYEHSTSDR